MRVEISEGHLEINNKLAKELNQYARNFSYRKYSRIEDIGPILLKKDISVEGKKSILAKKLHVLVAKTFSISRSRLNKKSFGLMKSRLQHILKLVDKLRSINYYLETTFLEDLKIAGVKIPVKSRKLAMAKSLTKGEFQALEYSAYRLIGEAAMLDKALLKEYSKKEQRIMRREKSELGDLSSILSRESELLEHLQAKIPHSKAIGTHLLSKPVFTHWASRVFALLAYFEHLHAEEKGVFRQLKKNKSVKSKIEKKISQLVKERAKLIQIMEQKAISMKKLNIGTKFKKELHNLTAIINV